MDKYQSRKLFIISKQPSIQQWSNKVNTSKKKFNLSFTIISFFYKVEPIKNQQGLSYTSLLNNQSRYLHRNHENNETIKYERKLPASLLRTTSELGSELK